MFGVQTTPFVTLPLRHPIKMQMALSCNLCYSDGLHPSLFTNQLGVTV
jgi:hypothetical protein